MSTAMNTSAINNPLGLLPTPATSNKQNATPSSGAGAFNQMLTREIDRSNNSSHSNDAAKNAQASGQGDKAAQAKTEHANNATHPDTVKKTGEAQAAASADDKETDATAVAPSAELLAFVAALTQAHPATAAQAGDDAETATTVGGKSLDATIDADAALNLAADSNAASGKDPVGKQSDFVAALNQATASTAEDVDAAAAPAATTAKAGAVELAAAAPTAKIMEPTLASNSSTALPAIANLTPAMLQQLNDTQAAAQSNRLAPQVGNPGWDQALGQKVVWMIQGAQQSATLSLNPPELGPMQVTLNVSNNHATANFTAHQPEVRHALEAAMPRLREMLNEAGIELGQSDVSAGTPEQQAGFSEQGQHGQAARHASNTAEEVVTHVSHVPLTSAGTGLVDTFA